MLTRARQLLEQMQRKAIEPNDTTYSAAISACELSCDLQCSCASVDEAHSFDEAVEVSELRLILWTRLLSYLRLILYGGSHEPSLELANLGETEVWWFAITYVITSLDVSDASGRMRSAS